MMQDARYFAEVSYDGRAYHGWQRQPNAISVQEVIEENMKKFLPLKEGIVASGRTDNGVHCLQQFFHFDVSQDVDMASYVFKLNKMLPADIAIKSLRRVREGAHARFDATSRSYLYRISPVKDVFARGNVWQFGLPLDLASMNKAAATLQTFQDFQALSKVNTDVNHFLCTIHHAEWITAEDEIHFNITANRFLRGMVRAIVGTCIDIGTGKTSIAEFVDILNSKDRRMAGAAAPPEGLFLSRVVYPLEIFER